MFLELCLYCGGTAKLMTSEGVFHNCAWVECNNCGASTEKYERFWKMDAEDVAKRKWNRGEVHKVLKAIK